MRSFPTKTLPDLKELLYWLESAAFGVFIVDVWYWFRFILWEGVDNFEPKVLPLLAVDIGIYPVRV
jgi:hypothetical protein